jgi:hypothetical protein
VTEELLARRILALEERIERVETTAPFTNKMIVDGLAELRRDTADRFNRMDQRFETIEARLGTIEGLLGQVLALIGGPPGRTDPPKQ